MRDYDLGNMFWDSISIFPGDGAGRLLAPTTLVMESVTSQDAGQAMPGDRYWSTHHQLNTNDLNKDGRVDVIGSPGVILLNRPAAPNRPPAAFAGADRTEFDYDYVTALQLRGQGADPDNHWVTYRWTDEAGNVLNSFLDMPFVRQDQDRGTTRTYTLTVDDGHGGVSSDSVTIHVPTEEELFNYYIFEPAPAEPIVAGMPSTVAWDIYDPTAILESLSLSYSIDDGRTFHVVPGCESLAPRARQCVWQNPGPTR